MQNITRIGGICLNLDNRINSNKLNSYKNTRMLKDWDTAMYQIA